MDYTEKRSEKEESLPPIRDLLRRRPTAGDIGLEIECEGNFFRKVNQGSGGTDKEVPKTWQYVNDGSLRGRDNAEYILTKPVKTEKVPAAVKELWDMFEEDGTVLDLSNRTSVHVHLNAQKMYLDQVCSFSILFIILEDLLTRWCGDHRVGNLFCIQAREAQGVSSKFKEFFKNSGRYDFSSGMHYAALNLSALTKFGSIEVRTMRGATDPSDIITWVEVLSRLKDIAVATEDPRSLVEGFSSTGYQAFLQEALGGNVNQILSEVSEEYPDFNVHDSLYKGIRIAQDLAYCRDWSLCKRLDPAKDPFSRRALKLTKAAISSGNLAAFVQTYHDSLVNGSGAATTAPVPDGNPPIWGGITGGGATGQGIPTTTQIATEDIDD